MPPSRFNHHRSLLKVYNWLFRLRPSRLPFFGLTSNAFPDIGSVGRSVGRIEKKKKTKKKTITRSLGIGGPGTPLHIWINKMHNVKVLNPGVILIVGCRV